MDCCTCQTWKKKMQRGLYWQRKSHQISWDPKLVKSFRKKYSKSHRNKSRLSSPSSCLSTVTQVLSSQSRRRTNGWTASFYSVSFGPLALSWLTKLVATSTPGYTRPSNSRTNREKSWLKKRKSNNRTLSKTWTLILPEICRHPEQASLIHWVVVFQMTVRLHMGRPKTSSWDRSITWRSHCPRISTCSTYSSTQLQASGKVGNLSTTMS